MAKTVLCYHKDRPNSLVRVDVELFNQDNEAADEAGEEHTWILADEDAESTAKTFDQCSEAEKKKVLAKQAERQAAIDAE